MQKSLICARELKRLYPNHIEFDEKEDFKVMFPAQWTEYLKSLQNTYKGVYYEHRGTMIVFLDECDYIGLSESFLEWALQEYMYTDNTSNLIYTKMSNDAQFKRVTSTPGISYIYLDFQLKVGAPTE